MATVTVVNEEDRRPGVFVPPLNFALVAEEVYRSGHPLPINYPFLENLGLKTIIYIGDRPQKDNVEYFAWAKSQDIQLIFHHVKSVKEPFFDNDPEVILESLKILVDTRNSPVLVHSNKGKHRIGVLVGVMRKVLQGWSLATIFDEYSKFAAGKGDADVEVCKTLFVIFHDINHKFIEKFQPDLLYYPSYAPPWLRVRED